MVSVAVALTKAHDGLTEYAISEGKQRIEGVTRKKAKAYLRAASAEERRSARGKSTWHASLRTIEIRPTEGTPLH